MFFVCLTLLLLGGVRGQLIVDEASSSGSWTGDRLFAIESPQFSAAEQLVIANVAITNTTLKWAYTTDSTTWNFIDVPCRTGTTGNAMECYQLYALGLVNLPDGNTVYTGLFYQDLKSSPHKVNAICIGTVPNLLGFSRWVFDCESPKQCSKSSSLPFMLRPPMMNSNSTLVLPLICDYYYGNTIVAAISYDKGTSWSMNPSSVSDKDLSSSLDFNAFTFGSSFYLSATSFVNGFPVVYSADGKSWQAAPHFPPVISVVNTTIFGVINEADTVNKYPWTLVMSANGETWQKINVTNCPNLALADESLLPTFTFAEPYGYVIYGTYGLALCSSPDLVTWTPWPLPFHEPVTYSTFVAAVFRNASEIIVLAATDQVPIVSYVEPADYSYVLLVGRP